jgi:hypothetical protein
VARPDGAAVTLIVVEAFVAVALLVTSRWLFVAAAAVALALTTGLLAAVVRAHRLGATDDCGCFGDWLPAAIGPRLIVRNVILVAVAGVLAAAATTAALVGSTPVGLPAALTSPPNAPSVLGAAAATVLVAAGVWSIARASSPASAANGAVRPRGAGAVLLPASAEIVDVLAPSVRARLLVFIAPGCHACADALASLEAADGPLSALLDVYAIQRVPGGPVALEPPHTLPRSTIFAVDVGGSLGTLLDIGPGTPVAALIGTDGTQAGPLAIGSAEIDLLLAGLRALSNETA